MDLNCIYLPKIEVLKRLGIKPYQWRYLSMALTEAQLLSGTICPRWLIQFGLAAYDNWCIIGVYIYTYLIHTSCGKIWNYSTCAEILDFFISVMCRNLKLLHMWENFRILHICHAQKYEIYPNDKFVLHRHICGICDKYIWGMHLHIYSIWWQQWSKPSLHRDFLGWTPRGWKWVCR